MRAQLRFIQSNDTLDWDTFAERVSREPWNDWGWFTLGIGPENEEGTDLFHVAVCTGAAKHKTIDGHKEFRGIVVDSFEPDTIKRELHKFVDSITGLDWPHCVHQLQGSLHWEYEGMA
ncbi:MAG: Imm8 family immunity protein [Planctomycetota bacterium]